MSRLTRLKPRQESQRKSSSFTDKVAELVAQQITDQISAEIPRIVENVSKAAAVEAVAVARDMPRLTADAILHVVTLGRVGG